MSIKKLKELEDLITQRQALKIDYDAKRNDIRDEETQLLFSLIQNQLSGLGFTVTATSTGVTGVYGGTTVTAIENTEKTEAETGLGFYIDFNITGTVEESYLISAYDVSEIGNPPDFTNVEAEPDPEKDELDVKQEQETQLIQFYQNFIDTEITVIYGFALEGEDFNVQFETADDVMKKLFT